MTRALGVMWLQELHELHGYMSYMGRNAARSTARRERIGSLRTSCNQCNSGNPYNSFDSFDSFGPRNYFKRFLSDRNKASARHGFSSVRTTQCVISRLRNRSEERRVGKES